MEETTKQQETVTVEKSVLESLQKQLEEHKKEIEKLSYVADKGRLARWESNHAGAKEKRVSLHGKEVDGKFKVVTAWKVLKDELITDPRTNSRTGEYQEIEVVYEDGTKDRIIGYARFAEFLYNEELQAKVLSEIKEYDGTITYKVEVPDGRQFVISGRYVN